MSGLLLAQKLNVSSDSPPAEVKEYVSQMAQIASVDVDRVLAIVNCESGFQTAVEGDHGQSIGAWQIRLIAHPDISKQAAQSLVFSTVWALTEMQKGNWKLWTCDAQTHPQFALQ